MALDLLVNPIRGIESYGLRGLVHESVIARIPSGELKVL